MGQAVKRVVWVVKCGAGKKRKGLELLLVGPLVFLEVILSAESFGT